VISDGEAYLSESNLTGIELKDPKDSGRSNNISLKIHPNPATTETTLTYVLPADGYVVMEIWNLYGKKVEAIYNGNQCSGTHILEFPVQIHTGVYTISLSLKTGHEQYKTAKKFIIKD
jgi:hypothetical protein